MSIRSALLIVKVIFVTTLFLCVFSNFLVNKDDQKHSETVCGGFLLHRYIYDETVMTIRSLVLRDVAK